EVRESLGPRGQNTCFDQRLVKRLRIITEQNAFERLPAGESERGLPHRRGHMITFRRDFGHADTVHSRERVCPAARVSGPLLKAKASVASLRSLGQVQPPV